MVMMMTMMMKPLSGDADKVLDFSNIGHENTELTIEKKVSKVTFFDVLTTKTNNRITNNYTKFIDAGSRTNNLSFTAKNISCIAKILVDWLYKFLNNAD